MLSNWLTEQTVTVIETVSDWKHAIELSAAPLLESGIITPAYIEAIYQKHEAHGPYYVLAPGIAMPHARPEEGVNQLGLSLLLVKSGVTFHSIDNDPVYVIIVLAASDDHSHLEMLTKLVGLFSASDDMQRIFNAQSASQILSIIRQY